MFKIFANRKLIFMLFSIMFFIAIMGLTVANRAHLSWPEQFFRDIIGWSQGVVSAPARVAINFFEEWQQISDVHEENEALRKTLSKYAEDTLRLNQLEADNKRLQAALQFTEEQKAYNHYIYHYADVTAYSGDLYNRSIVINRGKKDGIQLDMAVASVDGLVGRIDSVSQYYSTVQLLLDLNSNNKSSKAIAATVKGGEDQSFGVIEEYDRAKNRLRMTKIDPMDPMKTGDIVVTSGLGEVFPSGLVIGKIVERKVGEFGITHVAEIEPSTDFKNLHQVFVIELPVPR